jgi:hypothetical protein
MGYSTAPFLKNARRATPACLLLPKMRKTITAGDGMDLLDGIRPSLAKTRDLVDSTP